MPYVEASACGPSRRFVQAFWQSQDTYPAGRSARVLPDACVDFLFDLADPARPTQACAAVIGTMTRAIVVPAAGRRDLFGIRFRPGMVSLLWPLPMRGLCDSRSELDDVVRGGSSLPERLAATTDFQTRIAVAQTWIEARLANTGIDLKALNAVSAINTMLESGVTATTLADVTGWNERKLQRFFDATYGTTGATLRCFWRFEAVRRALTHGSSDGLSALALCHGYADQAHMAREFRRFTGLSIGAWRAESGAA